MSNDPWPTTKHTYTARASMKPDNVTQETWDSLCSMTDPDPDPHAARGDLASRIDAQLPKRLTPEADLYVDAADGGPPATPDRAATLEEIIAAAIQPMLNEYTQQDGNTICRVSGAREIGDSGRLIAKRAVAAIGEAMDDD